MRWRKRLEDGQADAPGAAREVIAGVAEDDGDEALPCLRCQTPLVFVAERDFQEGTGGWVLALGRLGALFEDSTRLEVWACKSCGHVEFFVPGVGE
jgi:hypothetical protein